MGVSVFQALAAGVRRLYGVRPAADPVVEVGMRVFADVTGIMRSRMGRLVMPKVFDLMEARSAVVVRGLFGDPRLALEHRSPLPALRRQLRLAGRYRIPLRIVQIIARPERAGDRVAEVGERLGTMLAAPPAMTPAERLDHVERVLGRLATLAPLLFPSPAAGLVTFGLAARLLRGRSRPGELQTVLRGLPHNVTTEMDLALWHAATRIRADEASVRALSGPGLPGPGELPPVLRRELDGFLARYGHRAVAEIDVGVPRWSEDPAHVLGVLANYLRLDDPALAPDAVFERGAREAEAMAEELGRRAGGLRGRVVRFALGRARLLAGYRETPKNYLIVTLGEVREHLRAAGADLAGRGLLDEEGDVFMLTLAEVRAALGGADHRGLVRDRRARYARESRRRHIPRVLLSDGTEPEAVASGTPAADGALTGTPASPGTVTGPARVVLDPVGARLTPGEILVAPSTDPGWTPLFLTAGGLVMEMGGANSHGAVVAREYGIPAVVGVADATSRVTTGQTITVDGTSGAVLFPDDEEKDR
ncbi:PEP-utilizing enzyme [Sphaerisporangium sp. B11E5]|uniref:PEP-utilizing enzyme n=1 Tax=Sphaerisporangium sp. B11E5 TaxID=3153563 RepID=UPI00325C4C48